MSKRDRSQAHASRLSSWIRGPGGTSMSEGHVCLRGVFEGLHVDVQRVTMDILAPSRLQYDKFEPYAGADNQSHVVSDLCAHVVSNSCPHAVAYLCSDSRTYVVSHLISDPVSDAITHSVPISVSDKHSHADTYSLPNDLSHDVTYCYADNCPNIFSNSYANGRAPLDASYSSPHFSVP